MNEGAAPPRAAVRARLAAAGSGRRGLPRTIVLAGGAWLLGCGATGGNATNDPAEHATKKMGGTLVGAPAPDIVVQRLNGKSLSVASMRGKVVLLDVWASWCGPCKQELPMLDAIAIRWKSRGVEVVAVSIDQERDNVEKFLASRSHWSLTVAHDANGAIADRLQPDKMPTSYLIDRDGIVRSVNSGFVPADAIGIEKRLGELTK